jgi:hypothetical protein
MPYVTLEPATRGSRMASAERRWAAVMSQRPDLEPALNLQRSLIGLVVDLAETIDRGRLPRLSLPPKYLAAKLSRAVPALAAEPIPVPVGILGPALLQLCDALARGGAGDAADHIRSALETNQMDRASLLAASLARDQKAIRVGALHRGLAPDLLWLVAELAVSPFAHALARQAFASSEPVLCSALANWSHGYCAACGSWPALAEVVSGRRILRCSFCAAGWELRDYCCIYCGEQHDRFRTAAPDEQRKDRRLELCSACGGYLKAVDVPELSPFPLLAIADLETMDLDMAAMEHRFQRPSLKEFAKR